MKYTSAEATIEGNRYEIKDRLANVSASIRQVDHPKKHGKWDLGMKISPSIHLDRLVFQTGHSMPDASGTYLRLPDLKYERLAGLANLRFTAFTPIGQFLITGGFGGAIYTLDDGQGLNTTKTREVRKLEFAYLGFLTKRIFILMGPRYYKSGFEQYTFAFRLGYFWGDF
ncbi:hypothetical protein A9Q84_12330 [Halobacteriovorax marinus]|uniref:Outer membrane protein beta-barrel domain-containing protein n=1 Tax=Halobacteriovorax marinus TaxID=97084 RepID=A0A1Y5FDZ5_9BACT|nr:hypothetical protein A9Q84_12330 [Halobacteriovorax marinus]